LYWESLHDPAAREPIDAPTGLSVFPKEIFPLSRRWAEQRFSDLRHYRRLDRGGHFAAFEQPERFVDEVRAFFRLVR
jgi:pimeloyl-ACP methyl ester carboxylesterase